MLAFEARLRFDRWLLRAAGDEWSGSEAGGGTPLDGTGLPTRVLVVGVRGGMVKPA